MRKSHSYACRVSLTGKHVYRHCEYMNACMIKDYVPLAPHHVVDHRYFFATQSGSAEIGSYTCGIAREAVARALRLYGRNTSVDYQFLLRALTTFANNPSVTGFLIEQAVLSSIGARGLDIGEEISSPMETIVFHGEFPEIKPDIKLALYCPLRPDFPAIDGLIVHFNKETKKCYMFPLQVTIRPRKQHSNSENMFFRSWPLWIRNLADFDIEVQFVWVLKSVTPSTVLCQEEYHTLEGRRFLFPRYFRREIPLERVSQDIGQSLERAQAGL